MTMLRNLLALALALATSAAFAQPAPQLGQITSVQPKPATYAAVALALPPAASATDIACIAGSATKTIRVTKIRASGTAGTLVSVPLTLVRRTSLDTGGTAATTTANWANTISKMDTTYATKAATLISYSANPTIVDSAPTYIRSDYMTLPVTSAGTSIVPLTWTFGDVGIGQNLQPTIRNGQTTQQLCLNLNGVSISSGLMHIAIEWTEE